MNDVADINGKAEMDAEAEGMLRESQAILRQKFDAFEKEKSEMQQKMQSQASSILHFQAYCQSLVIRQQDLLCCVTVALINFFSLSLDFKVGSIRGKAGREPG